MTKTLIENHIGYTFSQGALTYHNRDAKFETRDGRIIGGVRHSGAIVRTETGRVVMLAEDTRGPYWHFNETDGKGHCTRRIYPEEIAGPV